MWYPKNDLQMPIILYVPGKYHTKIFLVCTFSNVVLYTANIFKVIFTVFNYVRLSTVVSLYGLHLIAAPSTIK